MLLSEKQHADGCGNESQHAHLCVLTQSRVIIIPRKEQLEIRWAVFAVTVGDGASTQGLELLETHVTMTLERVDVVDRSIQSMRCSTSDRSVDIIEGCLYRIGTMPCCESSSFNDMASRPDGRLLFDLSLSLSLC